MTETTEAHRREVREAILHTTWVLVAKRGLAAVAMSDIAEAIGIDRATIYEYFPGVASIMAAWHDRHIAGHLRELTALRDESTDPGSRLESVLRAYASIAHHRGHQDPELTALLHQGEQIAHAQQQLMNLFEELLTDAARTGHVRDDVAPAELARHCLHALARAGTLPSEAEVRHLATATLSELRPPATT